MICPNCKEEVDDLRMHRENDYANRCFNYLCSPKAERSEALPGCPPSATGSADARASDEVGADSLGRSADKAVRLATFDKIGRELDHAYGKHGCAQWGRHEFYAILKEEVDELWDAIKADEPQEHVHKEAIQVAAMVFRYLETGDKYREPALTAERERACLPKS